MPGASSGGCDSGEKPLPMLPAAVLGGLATPALAGSNPARSDPAVSVKRSGREIVPCTQQPPRRMAARARPDLSTVGRQAHELGPCFLAVRGRRSLCERTPSCTRRWLQEIRLPGGRVSPRSARPPETQLRGSTAQAGK